MPVTISCLGLFLCRRVCAFAGDCLDIDHRPIFWYYLCPVVLDNSEYMIVVMVPYYLNEDWRVPALR